MIFSVFRFVIGRREAESYGGDCRQRSFASIDQFVRFEAVGDGSCVLQRSTNVTTTETSQCNSIFWRVKNNIAAVEL